MPLREFVPLIRKSVLLSLCWLACCFACAKTPVPSFKQLQSQGAVIGEIRIERGNVFDTSVKKESRRIHHLINRFHAVTREELIRAQLLFESGQTLDIKQIKETERILRDNKYLYNASVTVTNYQDGVVDLLVKTKDLWTLTPELDWSRSGGQNYFTLGIEDDNFLGTGASVTVSRIEDIDRSTNLFLYSNDNLANSRNRLNVGVSDSDDGESHVLEFRRPFFSLDSRWAAGLHYFDFRGEEPFYQNAIEVGNYVKNTTAFSLDRGWSSGRQNKWIQRISVGVALEDTRFYRSDDPMQTPLIPGDREYYYPFVKVHYLEDRYVTTRNFRTIDRVEDVYLGTQFQYLLGYATEAAGSLNNALIFSGYANHNIGSPQRSLLAIKASTAGRYEKNAFYNFSSQVGLAWTFKQSDRWQFFSQIDLQHSERPDLDKLRLLGGSSGLRGYPTRYRTGRGRALFTVEQRYYSNWYPLRLFRAGAAVFFDAGQVWGRNALGNKNDDFLMDAGIGLRLGSTKGGSKKVIHIDLAFPLNDDPSIDTVQFLIEAKQGF